MRLFIAFVRQNSPFKLHMPHPPQAPAQAAATLYRRRHHAHCRSEHVRATLPFSRRLPHSHAIIRPPTNFPPNATYAATLPQLANAQRAAITSGMLTVTYFSAPWCSACRRLQPKIAQLAANNPDIAFIQVSVADDVLREFCSTQLHLAKLPYFHIYRRGRLLAHFTANLEKISMLRAEIAALKLCSDPRCESS